MRARAETPCAFGREELIEPADELPCQLLVFGQLCDLQRAVPSADFRIDDPAVERIDLKVEAAGHDVVCYPSAHVGWIRSLRPIAEIFLRDGRGVGGSLGDCGGG